MVTSLSTNQVNGLQVAIVISSVASLMGSSFILYHIIYGHITKRTSYHRLVMGLSIADLCSSACWIIFSAFTTDTANSQPSTFCTIEGITIQLAYTAPYYNACMSVLFFLVICHGVKDMRIQKRYEPIFHAICVAAPIMLAIMGASLQVYNPNQSNLGCYINAYPSGCDEEDSLVECQRGESAYPFTLAAVIVPLTCIWLVIVYCNCKIYCKVRGKERESEELDRRRRSSSEVNSSRGRRHRRRSQQTATQSFLFVAAYFVTWITSLVLFSIELSDPVGLQQGKYYAVQLLEHIFFPSQGLFDCIIYFRPRFVRIRRDSQHNRSWWFALWKTIVSLETVQDIRQTSQNTIEVPPVVSDDDQLPENAGNCIVMVADI